MAAPAQITSPSAAPRATSQTAAAAQVLFALAALAALMSSIDYTIVAVAIPQFVVSFDASLALVSWTLTVYQLVQLIMLPLPAN